MPPFNRTMQLLEVDPEQAWSAWQPTASEAWDTRRAALLFRRAGFCASESMLRWAVQQPPQQVVDQFFNLDEAAQERLASFEAESTTLGNAARATGDVKQLTTWWLHRLLHSPQPLLEKMTLFWHGHFATGAEKVVDLELMAQQNQLLRTHALGDFRAMVHGISQDPAMLIYLDSASNRKAHANENFARELMELFCLGEGNYTEADVQQLARCFTGWEIRRRKFRFNPYQHDEGQKTLFGQQVETGEAAVDLVLAREHLPRFIARKLFRFFVCDEPAASDELIEPLALRFAADNLTVMGMVRTILGSRLMLSDWSFGRKISSPVELVIGLMRTLDATTNLVQLSDQLRRIGQSLFFPPNVKGWDGGRAWINSSTLVGRANLVHQLVRDERSRFAGGTLEEFALRHWNAEPDRLLDWFADNFLAVPVNDAQRRQLTTSVAGENPRETSQQLISLLAALPQFHLS